MHYIHEKSKSRTTIWNTTILNTFIQRWTKPTGRDGAKLSADYTDYAHKFRLREGKWRKKLFIWYVVQHVTIWFAERPYKRFHSKENVIFFLIKTPYCNTNPPIKIYSLLLNLWISQIRLFFCPAPDRPADFHLRPAPRIFILASLRRPAPPVHCIHVRMGPCSCTPFGHLDK